MLEGLKISTRLRIGFSVVLIIVLVLIIPFVSMTISAIVEDVERTELSNLYKSAMFELESEGRIATSMSTILASTPELAQAIAEGNRDLISARTVPLFKQLKSQYSVRQLQFHLPPAISFFRAHKPEKFGDDLSLFRKTIVETNRTKSIVSGLEKGVAGLGIRGISPVYYQQQHVGSVELGMSFGQSFFDNFKQKYGVNIALHISRDGVFDLFGSTLSVSNNQKVGLLTPAQLQKIMQGKTLVFRTSFEDTPYAVYGRQVMDFSGKPIGVMEISLDHSGYSAEVANARNTIIGIGVIALIIGFVIALYVSRSIVLPIKKAVAAMDEIAEGDGDLTQRLNETGNNEIARLGAAFNRFSDKVRNMVVEVSSSTTILTGSAGEMSAITEQVHKGVQKQQTEIEMVASAMNEMTTTVQEVSRHATAAASAAQTADNDVQVGKDIVEQTVSAINQLAEEIENATSVIRDLEANSVKIGSVLDVIKSIAEQTNLLALNAAIEAARAGEQGRGFAVVADEVRTLASRTQESTQEIQIMIEALQQGSSEAVKAMDSSQNQSKRSVAQAEQAKDSLEAIVQAITTISDMNIQIATAANEQSSVANEINQNIVNINQVVDQTADGMQQTQMASQGLSELANNLQLLIKQFKT
jgi:methyl-accepting chemotaxis protein